MGLKMKRSISRIGIGLIVGTMVLSISSFGWAAMTLKVGTGPVGGNWFPLGAVVCAIINEKVEGVRAAPTLGGGTSNLIALDAGTQDFSLTIGMTNANAWEGTPPFKKQYRNARSVFNTYINTIHAYTPAYTGIKTVEDCKGKRVTPGGKKGFTGEVMWSLILKEYGISYKEFSKVELVGYDEGANLMKDKHLDAYMILTFAPSAPFLEIDTFTPLHVFTASPEIQKRMIEKYPGFGKTIVPGGIYKNLPKDLETIGSPCVFACRKGLPADVIYSITKAFWENYKQTWKISPGFNKFIKPENALEGLALPLHPGAFKYYKEKGYTIPKRLMPID